MKLAQKKKSIQMRKRGMSITDIAKILGVSKGSVSTWVRDVVLSKNALRNIAKRSHSAVAVEKRRKARIENENKKRQKVFDEACISVKKLSTHDLFLVGIALYWGEGSKKKQGVAEFTNSDPRMIRVMKRFFVEICGVSEKKLRGHVYIHEHIDIEGAEKYWSKVSGIPRKQFHKTSIQANRSRMVKDTLPNGTFAILVCDTKLKLSIDGWTEGVYRNAL